MLPRVRHFLFALVISLGLVPVAAQATTQVLLKAELGTVYGRHGFIGTDLKLILDKTYGQPRLYDTAANLAADTAQTDGTIAYALDTHAIYIMENGTWQGVTVASGGNSSISGTLGVSGATTLSSTLAVTGAQTLTGATYSNGGVDRSTAAALAIGATNATAVNIGATATAVAVTAAGAVTVPSTLTVTNSTYLNGGLDRSTAAALAIGATNATLVHVTPPMDYKQTLISGGASYLVAFATDCGGLVTTSTDTHVTSLPVVTVASKGCAIELMNMAADGAALITLTPGTGDGIKGICGSIEMDGTANKSILNTKATQKLGDRIRVMSTGTAGAAGWIITSCSGVFARQS